MKALFEKKKEIHGIHSPIEITETVFYILGIPVLHSKVIVNR